MSFIDTTYDLVSYVNSNKNKISKIAINTGLLFIIFAVFGCFDFAHFSINPSLLGTWKYWTQVFTNTIGGAIAFNIGINLVFDQEIEKDHELEEQAIKYKRLNSKKVQGPFNYYVIEVFNREEKKKAYIAYINRKIWWLNRFAKNSSKLLYSNSIRQGVEDYEKRVAELEEKKAQNKYCVRRKELEELKSDEYIEKNIDSITIRYHRIDPIIFELEIDGKSRYHGVKVSGSVGLGRARFTSAVIMSMVLISMLFASIGLSPDQEEFASQAERFWHYLLRCATDVGIILYQTFRGMVSARKLVSQEMTAPLVGRNYILDKYYAWVVDNDIAPSRGEQIAKLVGEGKSNGKE